jgi:seryl-tRNA synthetase
MKNIEILFVKVKKTVEKLKKLTAENHKLKVELEYLRNENERTKKQVGEYLFLKRHTEEAVVKIERIIKKIDTSKVV